MLEDQKIQKGKNRSLKIEAFMQWLVNNELISLINKKVDYWL